MATSASAHYNLKNIRTAIGHYLLGRGAGAFFGLANAVLLVRNMSTPDYAAYTALLGIAGILGMLTSLGLERVITRFVPEGVLSQDFSRLRRFVWVLTSSRFLAGTLAVLVLSTIWPWIASFFDFVVPRQIPWPLVIYLFANTVFTLLSTILQALIKQKLLTRMTVFLWGGRLAWLTIETYHSRVLSLDRALWVMAVPEIIGVAVLFFSVYISLTRNTSKSARKPPTDLGYWPCWQEVRNLAGHSYLYSVLASVPQGYFMRTLVAATLSVEVVAAFGFFSSLVDRLRNYLPIQLMYNLVEPVLVVRYLENGDVHALTRNTQLMYKANLLLLATALIFILIGGSELVTGITNGKYVDQTWILALLMLQTISGSHILSMQLVLNVLKANELLSRSAFYALAVMLAYLAFALLSNNREGILFGTLIYSLVLNSAILIMMAKKGIPYTVTFSDTIKLAGIGSIAVFGIRTLLGYLSVLGILPIVIAATVGALGFFFLCLGFGVVVNHRDIRSIAGVIGSNSLRKPIS